MNGQEGNEVEIKLQPSGHLLKHSKSRNAKQNPKNVQLYVVVVVVVVVVVFKRSKAVFTTEKIKVIYINMIM